jgi:hypothetical protein
LTPCSAVGLEQELKCFVLRTKSYEQIYKGELTIAVS